MHETVNCQDAHFYLLSSSYFAWVAHFKENLKPLKGVGRFAQATHSFD